MSRASTAPEPVRRLHRAWHAVLGRLVTAGHLPRPLTRHERRAAQLRIFRELSVWDVSEARALALLRRLAAADGADIAWQVWQHGVLAPGDPDDPAGTEERLAVVAERLDLLMRDGMTVGEARRRLISLDPDTGAR